MDQEALIRVLSMATFLLDLRGRQAAKHQLELLPLAPTLKLYLARQHGIPGWICPAVLDIMRLPLSSLSPVDFNRMGEAYFVARAKHEMEQRRNFLALVPPGLELPPAPFCNPNQHTLCVKVWGSIWQKRMYPELLHPTAPMALQDTLDFMYRIDCPEDLSKECRQAFISYAAQTDVFTSENKAIEQVVEEVVNAFGIEEDHDTLCGVEMMDSLGG